MFLSMKLKPSTYCTSDYYWECRKMYGTYRILAVFVANLSGYLTYADLLSSNSAKES